MAVLESDIFGSQPASKSVLLLKPASFAFSASPPLGLMSLAAYIETRGYQPVVLDLNFADDARELSERARGPRPLAIGVTSTTPEFREACRLIGRLRALFPGVPVVVGGIHVSALGAEALDECGAGFGVIGEGEATLSDLLAILSDGSKAHDYSSVRGLLYRNSTGRIETNAPRPFFADLDALPFPSWNAMRSERYFVRPWHFLQRRQRSAFIMTSRGCPYGCTFCASHTTLGRTFRARSAKSVVDEMELLSRRHGVGEFLFVDDNLTFDRSRIAQICEEILRRGLDVSWRTPNGVRIDTLDRELLNLMWRSGCYLLGFGIESGSPEILTRVNKHLDLDVAAQRLALVKDRGIIAFGYFILGLPGETFDTGMQTLRYAADSRFDLAHFGLYAPYPGSSEFEKIRDRPDVKDWDQYLFIRPFPVSDLSPASLKLLLRLAYPMFYLKPSRCGLLAREMGPKQFAEAVRTLYHYMA